MRRLPAGIAVVLAVAACRESDAPAGPSGAQLAVAAAPAQTAPEKYIVIYKSTVGDPRAAIAQIGTGTTFTSSALSIGTHLIKLTVRDSKLAKAEAKLTLTVTAAASNQLPTATMTSPGANSSFAQGASEPCGFRIGS